MLAAHMASISKADIAINGRIGGEVFSIAASPYSSAIVLRMVASRIRHSRLRAAFR